MPLLLIWSIKSNTVAVLFVFSNRWDSRPRDNLELDFTTTVQPLWLQVRNDRHCAILFHLVLFIDIIVASFVYANISRNLFFNFRYFVIFLLLFQWIQHKKSEVASLFYIYYLQYYKLKVDKLCFLNEHFIAYNKFLYTLVSDNCQK